MIDKGNDCGLHTKIYIIHKHGLSEHRNEEKDYLEMMRLVSPASTSTFLLYERRSRQFIKEKREIMWTNFA